MCMHNIIASHVPGCSAGNKDDAYELTTNCYDVTSRDCHATGAVFGCVSSSCDHWSELRERKRRRGRRLLPWFLSNVYALC